jgi:Leucine-rich repeat (LRR) protein
MTKTIKTYLNSLSEDIVTLSINDRNITVLPDLTRFKNLKDVYCSDNKLTYLPTLPQNLEILQCCNNKLTSLPALPQNLEKLECCNNKLTSLPDLPQNLKILYCLDNKLTYLPTLPEKIHYFICWDNPIWWDILDDDNNNLTKVKQNIIIVNNFRNLYYSLQFKKQLRKWL